MINPHAPLGAAIIKAKAAQEEKAKKEQTPSETHFAPLMKWQSKCIICGGNHYHGH